MDRWFRERTRCRIHHNWNGMMVKKNPPCRSIVFGFCMIDIFFVWRVSVLQQRGLQLHPTISNEMNYQMISNIRVESSANEWIYSPAHRCCTRHSQRNWSSLVLADMISTRDNLLRIRTIMNKHFRWRTLGFQRRWDCVTSKYARHNYNFDCNLVLRSWPSNTQVGMRKAITAFRPHSSSDAKTDQQYFYWLCFSELCPLNWHPPVRYWKSCDHKWLWKHWSRNKYIHWLRLRFSSVHLIPNKTQQSNRRIRYTCLLYSEKFRDTSAESCCWWFIPADCSAEKRATRVSAPTETIRWVMQFHNVRSQLLIPMIRSRVVLQKLEALASAAEEQRWNIHDRCGTWNFVPGNPVQVSPGLALSIHGLFGSSPHPHGFSRY